MKQNKNQKVKFYIPDEKAVEIAFNEGLDATKQLFLELTNTVKELISYIHQQNKVIQNLSDQINKNSSNSSKPPSSEGYNKPPRQTSSLRSKSNKKTGGQPGHKGHTLRQSTIIDHVVMHPVNQCVHCQNSLETIKAENIDKRQVFDIPQLEIKVVEHQAEIKICPNCGHKNKGYFPKEVNSYVQYGINVKSVINYFTQYQLVPLSRTKEIFRDLFSHSVSEATIIKANMELEQNIAPSLVAIKQYLCKSDVLHVDESGVRTEGNLHWLHNASNEKATCYKIHKNRGSKAMDEIGIINKFQGTLVHDFWKAYLKYKDAKHSLCNAHHLRELKFITENYDQKWAKEMYQLLLEIKEKVDKSRGFDNCLPDSIIEFYEKRYDDLIKDGYFVNKQIDNNKKPMNLLKRLDGYKSNTLLFMHNFEVPFDNNQGERDIRMIKVKQKISGSFRTKKGADNFTNIRSFISTVMKNSGYILDELINAFDGKPFIIKSEI